MIDIAGQRFGKLKVLKPKESTGQTRNGSANANAVSKLKHLLHHCKPGLRRAAVVVVLKTHSEKVLNLLMKQLMPAR